MPTSVGLNVGGTFSNMVAYSEKGVKIAKVPSYAGDLPRILDESIQKLDLDIKDITSLVISFPLAMHPVLAKTGAEAGLILNEGYRDTLDIQEGRKPYVLRAQQIADAGLQHRRNAARSVRLALGRPGGTDVDGIDVLARIALRIELVRQLAQIVLDGRDAGVELPWMANVCV